MARARVIVTCLLFLFLIIPGTLLGQTPASVVPATEDINGILSACSSSHKSIYVLDKANQQVVRIDPTTNAATTIGLPSAPLTFAVHPNGTRLYVGMENNAIAVFDISSLPETQLPTIQLMIPVKEIAVSSLGDIWIDTKETFGTLQCWNSESESIESSSVDNDVRLRTSPDGSRLLHHTTIGNIKVSQFNQSTHCGISQLAESNFNFGSGTNDARWTPDSQKVLIVNGVTNRVSLAPVSGSTLEITQEYSPTNNVAPVAIAPSADGRYLILVTFKFNGDIPGDVIDTTTGEIVARFTLTQFTFFADQEKQLLTTGCDTGSGLSASAVTGLLKIYTVVAVTTSLDDPQAQVQLVTYNEEDDSDDDDDDNSDNTFTMTLRSTKKNISCKVRDAVSNKAVRKTRVELHNATEEAGPYTLKKAKRTNKKGIAKFPLRGLKKDTFVKCILEGSESNTATVKKKKKK